MRPNTLSEGYALGHSSQTTVPVRHSVTRLPEAHGMCEWHITGEDGLHYCFALTREQVFFVMRQLTERLSRMSSSK